MRPPISHIAVVIPAMNEDQTIGECLDSIYVAINDLRSSTRRNFVVSVVVVLDSCTDASSVIAAQFDDLTAVTVDFANVGRSRAEGIRVALDQLRSPRSATWIANTDADSVVPVSWLTNQIGLADAGTDVLLGTVEPLATDLTEAQSMAWHETHPHGRAVGHVHGANLGVRASAYLRVGGFAPQEEHEDADLVERLRNISAEVIGSDAFPVVTSGRTVGRTPGGYAGYLRLLDRQVAPTG